ncbi:porin family protein [Algoriphagus taiwanensis]|uniref:Porin family protein n=1 Tax=Algoriphagus taiwanensis TaxID=1445656 RepID=A0ABQ6PZM6_9BACT|nr:porin family protein [Algoriphagus taiwanensis]
MNRFLTGTLKPFLVLCFIMVSYRGYAQEIATQDGDKAQYGIKAGINFAELWGKDALPESDRKVGYSLGAYASYKLSKDLKLQPEIIWSLQGEDSKESGRYKISYINIPLMLKWIEGKFYSELGPQLGLLTINTSKSVPEELQLENFETFDFSINLGLGYKVAEDWTLGLRYSQGLSNIAEGRDLKNSVIYVGLAYRIF